MMPSIRAGQFCALFPFLTVFALFVLGACANIPALISEPSVAFDSAAIRKIGFNGVDMTAKIRVENGNPFTIPLPDIDWELFVDSVSFLRGKTAGGSKIVASSASVVEIPFTLSYKGLYQTAAKLAAADEAPYKINAGARFSSIPVLKNRRFEREFQGALPLPKAPALSFGGAQFTGKTPAKVEFVLTWLVENKNAFALRLD
jgi:LEA14-like dessication related protein